MRSQGRRNAFSSTLSVFGKRHFCDHTKSPDTTKYRGFSRHRGKPKMAFWFQKCHFGKGPPNELWLSGIHKSCALLRTLFYSVFSKHSFAEIKECKLKCRHLPKIGGLLPTCGGGCIFCCFFLCVCFFLFVFFYFGWKIPPKGYFSAVLLFFSLLLPQKVCLSNPSLLPIVLFSLFSFCVPFQNSILFLCFLAIKPFLDNIFFFCGGGGVLLSFFLFAFSFVNVCLFLRNKLPNTPFFKTNLL